MCAVFAVAGTIPSIKKLISELNDSPVPEDVEVVVAPNFIHLQQVLQIIKPEMQVAAQNCWSTPMGAYTGEVSAACSQISWHHGSASACVGSESCPEPSQPNKRHDRRMSLQQLLGSLWFARDRATALMHSFVPSVARCLSVLLVTRLLLLLSLTGILRLISLDVAGMKCSEVVTSSQPHQG